MSSLTSADLAKLNARICYRCGALVPDNEHCVCTVKGDDYHFPGVQVGGIQTGQYCVRCSSFVPLGESCACHAPKGDGDHLPGHPVDWKAQVPPEPPGTFRMDMHDRKPVMTPSDIASSASRLVSGDRNATHGDFRRNHANIAALWSAYLQARFADKHCITVTPHDAACMMTLLKLARIMTGAHNPDDYVDAVGYAAIAGGIAEQDAHIADKATGRV